VYYDQNQLRELKRLYDARIGAFLREVDAAWEVIHQMYESSKRKLGGSVVKDFEDLARKIMPKAWVKQRTDINSDPDELHWDKLQFRDSSNTFVEKNNRTYTIEIKNVGDKLNYLQDKLQAMYGYQNPVERVVVDERLNMLEKEFNSFIYEINPHHLQPGLLLDVDITTVKRKQFMMKMMANVLNEFLSGISQGFADAAFASFKRRRSTVRADIDMSFAEGEGEMPNHSRGGGGGGGFATETVSVSQTTETTTVTSSGEAGPAGGVKGSADVTPKSYEDKLKEMGLKEL
jgi:hypothetical protein